MAGSLLSIVETLSVKANYVQVKKHNEEVVGVAAATAAKARAEALEGRVAELSQHVAELERHNEELATYLVWVITLICTSTVCLERTY